jgi:fumarate reductase iron-sulfur subunit
MAAVLRVYRSGDGAAHRYDEFDVDTGPETTVLDALVDIQRTADSTLAFRYACRVGMCGSCAMVVNGRERWACRTRLASLGAKVVTVRPLYHFPLIRDLVVDMTPFRRRMATVGAAMAPREAVTRGFEAGGPDRAAIPEPGTPFYAIVGRESRERYQIDEAIECIGCGMCVSACTMVAHNERFPGPAALNRAFTLQRDHRDADTDARWSVLLSDDALTRCHGQGNCTEVCPMEIAPTTSILRLRRMATRRLLRS